MDLSKLRFEDSPNEKNFLNYLNFDDSDDTVDGWSFEENKLFEDILAKFDGVASDAFFEQASSEISWKCMKSLKEHYKVMMEKSKLTASSSSEKNIAEEEKRKPKILIIKGGGRTIRREY